MLANRNANGPVFAQLAFAAAVVQKARPHEQLYILKTSSAFQMLNLQTQIASLLGSCSTLY
jgi:hypothetical protein